ncbi:MAG: GNAT family N-acetyltransferase [Variibacter sp.]
MTKSDQMDIFKGLRRARADEAEKVAAFQRDAYAKNNEILGVPSVPLLADYAQVLRDYEVWVADDGDALAGVLVLELRPDDLLIWSVATAPSARQRGLGHQMLAASEERARAHGRTRMTLYTGEPLKGNIAWYQRHGYVIEHTEVRPQRRIVHMAKMLG